MDLPLTGTRILAVEQYGAGPYGTLQLASLGAEVIKIEAPGVGDVSRGVGPHFVGQAESAGETVAPGGAAAGDGSDTAQDRSLFYQGLNHSKKSIAIDLRRDEGQSILHDLAGTSSGLITNLRGDVPNRLGLDYASLSKSNKAIVCAHLTAYGRTGPRADWPGYDYVMQAQTGYFELTGEPDGPPARFGLSVVDLQTGVTLAMALLAGLAEARRTGMGRDLDVSLFDVALHNLNYIAMWSLNAGHHQHRVERSAHFSLSPCQLYTTADGWIYLMCNKEKFWQALCRLIERPQLAQDARFENFPQRLRHREALTEVLDEALSSRTTGDWLARFGNQVPAAPILGVDAALKQEFVQESGRILEFPGPGGERLRAIKPPVHVDEPPPMTAAPAMGQHSRSLLRQLGYSRQWIDRLAREKVIA